MLLAVFALGGAWLAGWAATCGFGGCPDLGELGAYQPGAGPTILDREGNELARLHPRDGRTVPLDSLPEHLSQAFIAVEDRRFHRHRGVDWYRVAGAALQNLRARQVREGASTITMQLARTLFPERLPGRERTARRKLLEVLVAERIERRFEKEEILELYLNHVYVGAGAYGVEAGARHYFGRSATDLAPDEAALLAGIVRSPERYNPRRNPDLARQRRDLVLALMEAQGRLSPERAAAARERGPELADAPPGGDPGDAPFFVQVVEDFLDELLGEALYHHPVRVHTTLDPGVQGALEAAIRGQIDAVEAGRYGAYRPPPEGTAEDAADRGSPVLQGAGVVMDPTTGEVLGLVGGRDYRASSFNRAVRARRQVGSAFKPVVYAAALERGYVPSQRLADRPLQVALDDGTSWAPRNYDGGFRGPVSMRRALVESLNVPTVRLALAVGLGELESTARRLGIEGGVPTTPAAALGTVSLSPLELTTAYAAFAAEGRRPDPHTVTRVVDEDGSVIHEARPGHQQVMDPRVAHILTDMMMEAVDAGTGQGVRLAGYRGLAAGKTGTTQRARDAWFVGLTPDLVGAVWLGHDRPHPILPGATGGRLAAPAWGAMATRVYRGREAPSGWTRPSGVVDLRVDPENGRVVAPDCPEPSGGTVEELFLDDSVPESVCPDAPGIGRRVIRFFRERVGSSSSPAREESPPGETGSDPDPVRPGDEPDEVLGTERLPLDGGRRGSALPPAEERNE